MLKFDPIGNVKMTRMQFLEQKCYCAERLLRVIPGTMFMLGGIIGLFVGGVIL